MSTHMPGFQSFGDTDTMKKLGIKMDITLLLLQEWLKNMPYSPVKTHTVHSTDVFL